jgi:hypothetical protein
MSNGEALAAKSSVAKGKLLILVLSVIAVVSLSIVYVHEQILLMQRLRGNIRPGLMMK